MEKGASDKIARSIAANVPMIRQVIGRLRNDSLEHHPELVIWAAEHALPTILRPADAAGTPTRQHYSFAAKFLHWTTHNHFPIVDSKARKRINSIQRQRGIKRRVRRQADGKRNVDDYRRWVCFYSD
jgi:hypothetical protein